MIDPRVHTVPVCPILMFHALRAPRSPIAFPPALFRDGMRRLADDGYHALDLADAAVLVQAGKGFPPKSIVLTFDDGYASVHEAALPVLVELGWPATLFVTTGAIGGHSDRGWPMADAGALRELRAAGVSIGGHTVTHPNLTRSTEPEIRSELEEGKERLQELLGESVRSFAYPFGRYDARSRAIAEELYDCACTDVLAYARVGDDPWLLPRIETWYLSRRWQFERFGSGAVDAYLAFRRGPRAMRRALVGSPR